ncbi:Hypothetical protein NTJ_02534 [Nesidiocoris tenuis]|uniref:FLYWCH-type domain-containing protein n=1 Tax=Nesidiocoris tenuis TaxID=355587 RepID=A0ABN7ABN2_9HEMI|nr:Hypothetical protein NTJ_02534 [Nesidiocoris tenuis]
MIRNGQERTQYFCKDVISHGSESKAFRARSGHECQINAGDGAKKGERETLNTRPIGGHKHEDTIRTYTEDGMRKAVNACSGRVFARFIEDLLYGRRESSTENRSGSSHQQQQPAEQQTLTTQLRLGYFDAIFSLNSPHS